MNRNDIQLLQASRGYPALSILLPTHRSSPANRQDPIRLKNLVNVAVDRLLAEFPKRGIEPLLKRLDALVAQVDFRHTLDGLGLYLNQHAERIFYLPFPVRERIVVDESFFLRDLVFTMNRSPRYWVLSLSDKPTRLFEGFRDTLAEVTAEGFPLMNEAALEPLPGGLGVNSSAYRDDRHRQFFRQIDTCLSRVLASDPLPLILAGVDRHLAFYEEVSANTSAVIARLKGNHDKTSAHELAKLVWPLVQEGLEQRKRQALADLEAAVDSQRYASGLVESWRMARENRAAVLLVEENYHAPARVDETGLHLTLQLEGTGPDAMEDAVDDLVEVVLSRGGQVVFVPDGSLAAHQQVAAILRF